MSVKIQDNSSRWAADTKRKAYNKLATKAIDVMRLSQLQAPLLTGRLRSSHRVERLSDNKYEVTANTPYARRQHFENKRRSLYLKKAGDTIGRSPLI